MTCSTGKTPFSTEELALEALVQNYIRYQHRPGAGPQDIYQCQDCENWHFTSRPPTNAILLKPETIARIKQEGRVMEWEYKFR